MKTWWTKWQNKSQNLKHLLPESVFCFSNSRHKPASLFSHKQVPNLKKSTKREKEHRVKGVELVWLVRWFFSCLFLLKFYNFEHFTFKFSFSIICEMSDLDEETQLQLALALSAQEYVWIKYKWNPLFIFSNLFPNSFAFQNFRFVHK